MVFCGPEVDDGPVVDVLVVDIDEELEEGLEVVVVEDDPPEE